MRRTPPASATQSLDIAAQTINFGGAGLPASITYPGSVTFTVTSTSGQPVTVGLVPDPSPYCTLTSKPVTGGTEYTLTATAAGPVPDRCHRGRDHDVRRGDGDPGRRDQGRAGHHRSRPLTGKVYGEAPFTVAATGGGSGNPVTFSSHDRIGVHGQRHHGDHRRRGHLHHRR